MKRAGLMMLLIALVGCSTSPLADFLDVLQPGRIRDEQAAPYGGVCQPQNATPLAVPGPPPVAAPLVPSPAPPGAVPPPPTPATPTSTPAVAPPVNTSQPR